jgi:hypothetical protein
LVESATVLRTFTAIQSLEDDGQITLRGDREGFEGHTLKITSRFEKPQRLGRCESSIGT